MASAPQSSLPLFYNELTPLLTNEHQNLKGRPMDDLAMLRDVHAVPLTTDEFFAAQRAHPIVFSSGDDPLPLQLFGLNEGVNLFLDEANMLKPGAYLPGYVRRYPFMLVKLQPAADDLSLCFDPASGLLGDFEDGLPLFENDALSEHGRGVMEFCEQFEMAAQRTTAFVAELKALGLFTEGEFTIELPGNPQPFAYRGFQIVNEDKLKALRGDQLRKMMQNGMLPVIHAHLISLQTLQTLFQLQLDSGQVVGAEGIVAS